MKRVTTVLALVVVAAAALLYSRTLSAADTDFPIYFENSTLALKSQTIGRTTYLPLVDIVRHLNLGFADAGTTFTLQGANTKVALTAGSASIAVNDQQVLLQNPIRRENGQWLVPLDFLSQGLAKVTGFEFRYRPGNSRVFAGSVSPAELTVNPQTQGGTTRITLHAGTPIDVELQRDTAQRQAVLILKGRPVDPARERTDFKDRMVQSIVFNDSDGTARLVISTTDEARAIRLTPSDEKRTYLLELAEELLGEATAAAPAPPPPPPALDTDVGPTLPIGNLKVIAIDAGHGGIDHGAANADSLEKDITLSLARRLKMELQSRLGASVVLTRDSDVELSAEARTETANNNQAELFISLHVGYSPNKSDSGASIFVMKPDFSGGLPPDPTGDRLFLPWYMAFRSTAAASQAFAKELQTDLNQTTAGWKFAVRSAPIGVLASLTMPAVAIEAGNLNNVPSAQTLTDPAFQTRFSGAIAEAVSRFSQKSQGGKR